jgi:hypothetical protein
MAKKIKLPRRKMANGGKSSFEDYYKTVPKNKNDTSDYSLREAYTGLPYEQMKAFANSDAHLPDVYKLPNHPTFSVESKYYKPGMYAGYWGGNDSYIPLTPENTRMMPGQSFETKEFADGGRLPIITNNPNDPRIKAYQDSLNLHNLGREGASLLLNPNTTFDSFNHFPIAERMLPSFRNLRDLNGVYPEPTGHVSRDFNILRTGRTPMFTKPVQPIVYQPKEDNTPIRGYYNNKTANREEFSEKEWKEFTKQYGDRAVESFNWNTNGIGFSSPNFRKIQPITANIQSGELQAHPDNLNINPIGFKPGTYFTRPRQGQEQGPKLEYYDKSGKKLMKAGGTVWSIEDNPITWQISEE